MYKKLERKKVQDKKHLRIRNKITGTPERPRLSVFRSNKNIYAQLIDDTNGTTIAASSTLEANIKSDIGSKNDVEAAKKVGQLLAKKAMEKGVKRVVFDRSGYVYHGKIAALADGAREGGLEF